MTMAAAFSPAHITGLFQICDESANPLHVGSKGAGVSIAHGVKTKVVFSPASRTRTEIWINGQQTSAAQVSEAVVKAFLAKIPEKASVRVEHEVEIPTGSGFGSSGAAALSLALALNAALELGLTRIQAAQIAHVAEVSCGTGLGTVLAATYGGLEMRVRPGAPGIGKVQQIPFDGDPTVACLSFGELSTERALANADLRRKINQSGRRLVASLEKQPSLLNFLVASRSFAENTGLVTLRVKRVLEDMRDSGIVSSMPMFGEGAFSIVSAGQLGALQKIFEKHCSLMNQARILFSKIDQAGARIL